MQAICLSLDMTPDVPVGLGGFARRPTATRVAERLEMNLIALREHSEADPVLLITCDLLYIGSWLRERLEASFTLIPPHRLFVAASHTHSAPMTDRTKPKLGTPDPAYLQRLAAVCEQLSLQYADAQWIDVDVGVGKAAACHSINRRRRKRIVVSRHPRVNAVVNAPNPGGSTDETVTKLVLRTSAGSIIGVAWNYACHPVAYPDDHVVSGHFPAVVREHLRADTDDPGLPVLFFQGFSGDTRPSASSRPVDRRTIRGLVRGPTFHRLSNEGFRAWSEDLAEKVSGMPDEPRRSTELPLRTHRATHELSEFVNDSGAATVSFQAVELGETLRIVGVGAEVVSEYAAWLRAKSGSTHTMCVGCIDHTFGYVPTGAMMAHGGYEAGGYCQTFGLGALRHDIQEKFETAIDALLEAMI